MFVSSHFVVKEANAIVAQNYILSDCEVLSGTQNEVYVRRRCCGAVSFLSAPDSPSPQFQQLYN